ncbi:hypothetical protein BH09PSE5_BH09PSE5_03920 [soil metagenome]
MALSQFRYRDVDAVVITADDKGGWTWAYRIDHLALQYSGGFSADSEEAAIAEATQHAKAAIDRLQTEAK